MSSFETARGSPALGEGGWDIFCVPDQRYFSRIFFVQPMTSAPGGSELSAQSQLHQDDSLKSSTTSTDESHGPVQSPGPPSAQPEETHYPNDSLAFLEEEFFEEQEGRED